MNYKQAIRTSNDERGFGQGFLLLAPPSPLSSLMLIVTEISVEYDTSATQQERLDELTDTLIRIIDLDTLLERHNQTTNLNLDATETPGPPSALTDDQLRLQVIAQLSEAAQRWRRLGATGADLTYPLQQAFDLTCELIRRHGGDVQSQLGRIIDRNASRPYKHGRRA